MIDLSIVDDRFEYLHLQKVRRNKRPSQQDQSFIYNRRRRIDIHVEAWRYQKEGYLRVKGNDTIVNWL